MMVQLWSSLYVPVCTDMAKIYMIHEKVLTKHVQYNNPTCVIQKGV